jgi:hypothetical protein
MAKRKPTDIVSLKVRFTEALRARIEQDAKKNNRSLNREIVHRLGISYGAEGVELANQFEEHEKEMAKRLHEIVENLASEARKRK